MTKPFELPESFLTWLNGRLEAKDQPFHFRAIELHPGGGLRLMATLQKFMITADIELRAFVRNNGRTLVVEGLRIETTNPMVKSMIDQFLPMMVERARVAVAPHAVEIIHPAPEGESSAAS